MRKFSFVLLLGAFGACSQQAPETGNGPGSADGAGRAPDPASEAAESPAADTQGTAPSPASGDASSQQSSEAQSIK